MKRSSVLIAVMATFWLFSFPLSASSFALRGLEAGSLAPDIELVGIAGKGGKLSSYSGQKGLIVIYWATWSSRSASILAFAEKDLRRYEKLGMNLVAINADHQEMKAEDLAAVGKTVAELGLTFPVVLDPGLKGYNEFGVISTPTTIFLDKGLKIIDAYPGFPSVGPEEIAGRIDSFLGIVKEKRVEKAQYLLDHKPKNYALQYYNLGKQLFLSARSPSGELKTVPDPAIERLDEAIRRDPDYFKPYLLKAIILTMANANGRRQAALDVLRKKDFQEDYERRVLGFGYLHMGMDNAAGVSFELLSSRLSDDPGALFGTAVAAARKKEREKAQKALSKLGKIAGAREALGFDHVPLFAASGELAPGHERPLREALERLLEIGKPSSGGGITIGPSAPKPPPVVAPGGPPSPAGGAAK